jgi:hypothetical protein
MGVTILITSNGIRAHRTVYDALSTRIRGVSKIRWYGPATRTDREYFSLSHDDTGRALNKVPLTSEEADRLIDELCECHIKWDRIVDGDTANRFYVERLSDGAKRIAGAY